MHVFLSHARADADWVSRLASELKERGLNVWWDAKIKPGQRWDEALRRAIDEADACLVLVSEASDPSEPWLSREWSTIQERSWAKPNAVHFTILMAAAKSIRVVGCRARGRSL